MFLTSECRIKNTTVLLAHSLIFKKAIRIDNAGEPLECLTFDMVGRWSNVQCWKNKTNWFDCIKLQSIVRLTAYGRSKDQSNFIQFTRIRHGNLHIHWLFGKITFSRCFLTSQNPKFSSLLNTALYGIFYQTVKLY